MLKKLGRQLTILNVLISGAIMIAMAAFALGMTERMLITKNENELRSQLNMVISTISSADKNPEDVLVQFALPEKYLFYADNTEARKHIVVTGTRDDDEVQEVLTLAREHINDGKTKIRFMSSTTDSSESVSVFSFQGEEDEDSLTHRGEPVIFLQHGILPDTISDDNLSFVNVSIPLDHTSLPTLPQPLESSAYRVAALGDVNTANVVMVMQDLSEELHERDKLRIQFVICVSLALVLIVISSLFFSSKAVAPVETMIRKQHEFVAAASHELRTPIASVRANAEVLNDANLGDYEPYLKSIQDESEKMTRLVADLLCLARRDTDKGKIPTEPLEIVDVARDVLEMIAPLAKKRKIRLESTLHSAMIAGNTDRLRQVMIALLDNSLRYTPKDGFAHLSTGFTEQRAWILIEDSGPGIPDEQKQRAFERFYRLDAARSRDQGGSGLGLSIAKELTESMSGKITLKDRTGGGCSFLIEFPRLT